jgi:LmbE family N-acetylglucosaminyl deacetylase
MILSPHPDDECILGSLALRLMHENNAHVVNVAVTLGSNKTRQKERAKELTEACNFLEMECIFLSENWKIKEKELKSLIKKYQPQIIICPHSKDFHPTHIKTAELCKKVLLSLKNTSLIIAWGEFWGQLQKPNVLIEVPVEIVELQMKGLEKHAGEINRNPYHLRLPAWMMDNVRRGSEVIAGQGAAASNVAFGVLYKIQILNQGKFKTIKLSNHFPTSESNLGQMFKLILEAASGSKTRVK